jgi:hypothetical protein
VLTVPEVFALAGAVPPRFRALVLLATFGSLRWGELAALRRFNLDLDARTVKTEASVSEMKTGELVTGQPKSVCGHGRRAAASKVGDHSGCLVCDCRCRGVSDRSHGRCARLAGDGWPAAPDHGLRPWRGGAIVMTDLFVGGLPRQD